MFGSEYYNNNYLLRKSQLSLNKIYEKDIKELFEEIEELKIENEKLRKIILTLI